MPYRPSTAWFELNAGSAFAGVLPASVQAAAVGSAVTLVLLFGAGFMGNHINLAEMSFWAVPALIVLLLLTILISTPVCVFGMAVVGVPVAFLLGFRLDGPLGLCLAIGIALAMGLAVSGGLGAASVWGKGAWIYSVLVTAYALPGGLFYRRAVLTSRALSPWDEAEPGPAA
jgi:hypothetical protein